MLPRYLGQNTDTTTYMEVPLGEYLDEYYKSMDDKITSIIIREI